MNELVARLKKAEETLSLDLVLTLQSDGSGSISDWTGEQDKYIFEFDTIRQLDDWLSEPRVTDTLPAGVEKS
jgi:hypothetical protein